MKKESTIRAMLGVSQTDMAGILQVSRGHFAMFELGKRDLPLHAKLLLAEILGHLKAPEKSVRGAKQTKELQLEKHNELQQLLDENERQRLLVATKLKAANKKQEAAYNSHQVVNFLNEIPPKKAKISTSVVRTINRKATRSVKSGSLGNMLKHQIRLEVLEFEKLLLESKIQDNR